MTMAAELFQQFQTYWKAGTDARLYYECHAGKVWMNLQIHLDHPPPPPPLHSHRQQPGPRQSPSRLRRRARRAEARAAAKAAESKATEDVAVQTEDKNVNIKPADPPLALLPSLIHNAHGQHHHQEAGEADEGHIPLIPDVFCPDKVYHHLPATAQVVPPPPCQDAIPQVDGHAADVGEELEAAQEHGVGEDHDWINPDPVSGFWICRCCYYAHSFMTEDDLKKHHDTLMMEYDECNICYPWHVWS